MAHTLPAGQFPGFTSSEVVIVKINVDDVVGDVTVEDVGETVEEDAGEIVVDYWFIGLLVYLHDQTGYTTNNYLVSCRISS